MCQIESEPNRQMLKTSEENMVFQSSYKETTQIKSSKVHGQGYMAKNRMRRELMKENIEVLARAEAAAKEKSLAFEVEIEKLKEQRAHEAAEREREKEENRRRMQEDLESAKIALKEELKQEFLSMLAQQKKATLNQVKFSNNVVLIFQLVYNVVLIIHLFSTMLVYASFLYRCFFMLASCITCSLAWKRMVNLYVLLSSITA